MTPLITHKYISMACLHDQHDQCDLVCTYCKSPCLCPHHKPTPAPSSSGSEFDASEFDQLEGL